MILAVGLLTLWALMVIFDDDPPVPKRFALAMLALGVLGLLVNIFAATQ